MWGLPLQGPCILPTASEKLRALPGVSKASHLLATNTSTPGFAHYLERLQQTFGSRMLSFQFSVLSHFPGCQLCQKPDSAEAWLLLGQPQKPHSARDPESSSWLILAKCSCYLSEMSNMMPVRSLFQLLAWTEKDLPKCTRWEFSFVGVKGREYRAEKGLQGRTTF